MKNLVLFAIFVIHIVVPNAHSMDKRAPVSILPYKQQSLKLVYSEISSKSRQYLQNGSLLSTSESSLSGSKLIYRNTFVENFELGIEIPYIFNRSSKSVNVNGTENKSDIGDDLFVGVGTKIMLKKMFRVVYRQEHNLRGILRGYRSSWA